MANSALAENRNERSDTYAGPKDARAPATHKRSLTDVASDPPPTIDLEEIA